MAEEADIAREAAIRLIMEDLGPTIEQTLRAAMCSAENRALRRPPYPPLPELRWMTRAEKRAVDEAAPEPGVAEIAAERKRQREVEGWTEAHDDEHGRGEMAQAAACYLATNSMNSPAWPWSPSWWKPSTRIRDLEKAGALIAAEIARLKRALKEPGHGK